MRLSRLGTDSSLPPDYQGFRAASELGRSILAAGQPSSCRPTTDRGCKAAIQGAAPHRRIRRRDQGRAVGDESASRNRKFESTPLQRRVCVSRDFALSRRKAGLFQPVCGAERAVRSGETGVARRYDADGRQGLSRAKFQYRSVDEGGGFIGLRQSRARSAAHARPAADASAPAACPRSDRAAGGRRGWLG
jgi:hypothetical protein